MSEKSPYNRVFNFSAGPAVLPVPVLEQVRDDLLNYKNSGMSVMEMSHRSKEFDGIMNDANSLSRELLGVPDTHEVLFMQGGASLQFSMAAMNLVSNRTPIDVINTGYWVELAMKEMQKITETKVIFDGTKNKFNHTPKASEYKPNENSAYLYLCSNNTIEGSQMFDFPTTTSLPVVADMSSDFLSRPLEVSKFGLIFAGAQKNLGPSGVTMAIIRKDLAERAAESLPTMMQYRTHIKAGSRYNTPPAFGIYVSALVMKWIKDQGGLKAMEAHNRKKADVLYNAINEGAGFYACPVDKDSRSLMNVVFRIKPGTSESEALEAELIGEAKKHGILEIKGHRAVGGMRASIYNAQPIAGVEALASLMRDFAKRKG